MCVYFPPDGSVGYALADSNGIEILKSKILVISSRYPSDFLCLFGDFNSRTGQKQYFICDGFQNVPRMDWYTEDSFNTNRSSKDRVLNKFDLSLLDWCLELDCHIVNSWVKGDERGEM